MKINCEFESFEEMLEFAAKMQMGKEVPKREKMGASETPVIDQPVQGASPQPLSYEQQIASDFPRANTGMASVVSQVQTAAPTYTLDDLSSAAMTLMDKGMQMQLQQLLMGYGVASLPELPKEQYGAFATALRGMGAQI